MTVRGLRWLVPLLWWAGTSALLAAVPPDLAESARQIEQLAATRGAESESARLKRFFDLYWATYLREFPDLAAEVGQPGLDDRWPDRSPEALALIHHIARLELAALSAIDRSRLTPAEQVDHDLAHRRLEMQIEGERFHDLEPSHNELLLIDQMSGIDQELAELAYRPARTVEDYEAVLARLRGFPTAVEQTLAQLARGLAAGITPPRETLRDVPERVASLIADDPWQSPVLASFQELPETIPATERERLRHAAARVFAEQVGPALRRLHDYLAETYVPRARVTSRWATCRTARPGTPTSFAIRPPPISRRTRSLSSASPRCGAFARRWTRS